MNRRENYVWDELVVEVFSGAVLYIRWKRFRRWEAPAFWTAISVRFGTLSEQQGVIGGTAGKSSKLTELRGIQKRKFFSVLHIYIRRVTGDPWPWNRPDTARPRASLVGAPERQLAAVGGGRKTQQLPAERWQREQTVWRNGTQHYKCSGTSGHPAG